MKCPVACCLSNRAFLLSAMVVIPLAVLSGVAMRSASGPAAGAGSPPCAAARQSCSDFHATERPAVSECAVERTELPARPEACTGAVPVAP